MEHMQPTLITLSLLALLLPSAASGQVPTRLTGKVIGVVDGDTLDLLDAAHRTHRIRLAAIDAPERGQAFGARATQHLRQLAGAQQATAHCTSLENRPNSSRQRAICTVYVRGADVNLAMVRAGKAWHYRHFSRTQTPVTRAAYADAEAHARRQRNGLWADPAPIAPWEWRRQARPPKQP